MRSLTAAVLLPLIASCVSVVHAQGFTGKGRQQLIVDVRSLDLEESAAAPDRASIYPLGFQGRAQSLTAAAQREGEDRQGAPLVDSLSVNTQVLAPPGSPVRVRGGRVELPAGKTHLSLRIDGKKLLLYVVESVRDRNYPFRHVTAAVINQGPGAYARFAVDDWNLTLAGTVRIDTGTYRILPSSTDAQIHVVYRLPVPAGARDQRFIAISDAIDATSDVTLLENRHVLAEVLADYQPAGYYITSPVGASIWGQEGANEHWPTMDPARAQDPDAIAALIQGLAPLTGARGDERLMVERVRRSGDGVLIIFRQLLRGLPVDLRQRLELTRAGSVRRLTVRLLDESWLPEGPSTLLTSTAAEALARKALTQHLTGPESSTIERVEESETMMYDIVEYGSLAPKWRSSFLTRSGSIPTSYSVSIDLRTGESLVVPMRLRY